MIKRFMDAQHHDAIPLSSLAESFYILVLHHLPVFLRDCDFIHIHTLFEPPFAVCDLDIVAAHLALLHQAILCKRPVLEAVASIPLTFLVMPLVPELHGNLIGRFVSKLRGNLYRFPGAAMSTKKNDEAKPDYLVVFKSK